MKSKWRNKVAGNAHIVREQDAVKLSKVKVTTNTVLFITGFCTRSEGRLHQVCEYQNEPTVSVHVTLQQLR